MTFARSLRFSHYDHKNGGERESRGEMWRGIGAAANGPLSSDLQDIKLE